MACPWERSQDLPASHFGSPASTDVVFSVSHAWRNQAHPDPTGRKHRLISQLLASQEGLDEGAVLLFLDWTSIPQRPFRPSQPHRTPGEAARFAQALKSMHNMYFYADRVIHLQTEEDEAVEEEGLEYVVSGADLGGATFAQVGDWVQIFGDSRVHSPGERPDSNNDDGDDNNNERKRTWNLFDRVLSVDGERVLSAEHLQFLLSLPNAALRSLRLCRCPFGKINDIPAESRGWLYLERFITMVKCAMLDEAAACKTVVTNAASLRDKLLLGASRLRDAARLDDAADGPSTSVHLRNVLRDFLGELETKCFSAASTDKLFIDMDSAAAPVRSGPDAGGSPPDREVVAGIMAEFVDHLCEHWQAEAKKQQRRERRLGAVCSAAKAYFLDWNRFSDEYMEEICAAPVRDPRQVLTLLLLPPVLFWPILLMPGMRPDEDHQLSDFTIWFPAFWGAVLSHNFFPEFLATVAGLHRDWYVNVKLHLWTVTTAATNAAFRAALSWWWGVFPLPMGSLIAAGWCANVLPPLWHCIPRHQRADRGFRRRALCAFLALNVVLLLFALVFPLLNVALYMLDVGAQAAAIPTYLVLKLGFERMGQSFARYVGADVMPCFLFAGSFFFEFNLCVGLAGGFNPLVFAELTALDLAESVYHLWSLAHQEARHQHQGEAGSAEAKAKQYYIMSELVLREFVQLLAPIHFLLAIVPARLVRPEFNDIVCMLSEQEFNLTVLTVGMSVAVQVAMGISTTVLLREYGFQPLQALQGLLATHRSAFLATAIVATAYYMGLQHANLGNDLSFRFLWMKRDAHAQWQCGLQWTEHP